MRSRMIFWGAFCGATIVVILLALLSPKNLNKNHPRSLLDMSLYIQKPHLSSSSSSSDTHPLPPFTDTAAAFIFRCLLTEGPDNNSRVVGKAQGFIILTQQSLQSPLFNVIYMTFETPERLGSLSLQAAGGGDGDDKGRDEEFRVVGGTGSFAFARGVAVFSRTNNNMGSNQVDASYYVRLDLQFPSLSPKTPA